MILFIKNTNCNPWL